MGERHYTEHWRRPHKHCNWHIRLHTEAMRLWHNCVHKHTAVYINEQQLSPRSHGHRASLLCTQGTTTKHGRRPHRHCILCDLHSEALRLMTQLLYTSVA